MRNQPLRVLLVDDESSLRDPLAKRLSQVHQYVVETAATRAEALARAEEAQGQYDVALIDDWLTPETGRASEPLGIDLMAALKARYPAIECILFTGWGMNTGLAALRAGAYRYVRKPFDTEELAMMIEHAAEYRQLKGAARERQILEQLLTISSALLKGHTLPEVITIILHGVQALAFDRVRLYLLSADGQSLEVTDQLGMSATFTTLKRPVADDEHLRRLVADPRPTIFRREPAKLVPYERELEKEDVNEWVCAPLLLQGKVIGKLAADNKCSQRPICEAELGPIGLFATQAAVAIENARLMEATQLATQRATRYARNLEALQEISRVLSSTTNVEEICQTACKAVVDLFEVSHSGLVQFEPDYKTGRVVAEHPQWGTIGTEVPLAGIPAEEDLITNQVPVILSDVINASSLGPVRQILAGLHICSILIVPMVSNRQVIASFSLDVVGQPRIFTAEEVELCKTFAAQVAVALENARLFAETQRHAAQLEKLRNATLAITAQLQREALLQAIVKQAAELLGGQGGCIHLYHPEHEELETITLRDSPPYLQRKIMRVGEGMAGKLIQSGAPSMIVDDYEDWSGRVTTATESKSLGAVINVLIQWRGCTVGVLGVNDQVGRKFSQEEADLLRLFADHVAVTLENAELVTQLEEQKDHWARLIDSAPLGVIATDKAGRVLNANEQTRKMLNYDLNEASGTAVADYYVDPKEARHVGALLWASSKGKIENYPTVIRSKDGEHVPIRLSATWLYDAEGKHLGGVGYFEDRRKIQATEKRLELLLKASNVVAQAEKLDDGLQRLAELLVTFLGVSFGGIELLDEREFLKVEAAFPLLQEHLDWNPRLGEQIAIQDQNGLAEFLAQTEPYVLRGESQAKKEQLSHISHEHQFQTEIQSMLFIPIRTGERAVGLLFLGELRPWAQASITTETMDLAVAIASQTAVLIERMRVYENESEARKWLRSFYNASNTLVSSLDSESVLQDIVGQTRVVTKAERVSILLIDEASAQARHLVTAGAKQPLNFHDFFRPNGLSMQVVRQGQPIIIEDVEREWHRIYRSVFWEGIGSSLCLPLSLRGKRIGVMWIAYATPQRFPEWVIEAIQLYVNQAAIAYDNSRQMSKLQHLHQAAQNLSEATDVNSVLERIVHDACKIFRADSAAIWSYDAERDKFIIDNSVAAGIPAEIWEEFLKKEPRRGQTAEAVMQQGWIDVEEIDRQRYPFLGESTQRLLQQIEVKSFSGIALAVGEEKLGILYVNYKRPHRLSQEEREVAQTFSNHAALALKKANLLNQVVKARNVAKVVADVTVFENLSDTLEMVAKETQNALHSDVIALYVYNQEYDSFHFPPTLVGAYYPERAQLTEVPQVSIISMMLHKEQPYIVEDIAADSLFQNRRFAIDEKIASCIALPLKVGTDKVGVIFINYRVRHRFTGDEITNIQLFANQAAVAIRNAQLYETLQKRADDLQSLYNRLQRHSQHQQAVYAASKVISNEIDLNPKQLLDRILEQAVERIRPAKAEKCLFGAIQLYDKETNELHVEWVYPPQAIDKPEEFIGQKRPLDRGQNKIGVSGRAVLEGQPQRVADVRQDPDYLDFYGPTRSQLSVPLLEGDQVIGALGLESDQLDAFDEEDEQALCALAELAVIAWQNSQRYQELRKTQGIIETRTALAWMGMANNAWRHSIEKHALTIRDQIQLLRRNLNHFEPQSNPAHINARLDMIERLAYQIGDKPVKQILSANDGIESVLIKSLITERTQQLWRNDPYREVAHQLDLQITDTLTVRANPEWLRRVLDILLENAVNAVSACAEPMITIGAVAHNAQVKIWVTDTGPGIPEEIRARIGVGFIEKPEAAKGMGMGLLMAHIIVQTYGGEIQVKETGPTGTTMMICLPVE